MKEIVFDSVLLKDGHLSCPSRLARHNAHYKVIATFPDEDATELDIERASVQDIEGEYISEKEIQSATLIPILPLFSGILDTMREPGQEA